MAYAPRANDFAAVSAPIEKSTRDWAQTLVQYRTPNSKRAIFELCITLAPFVALWALAWWATSISALLAIAIALRCLGVLTLTPYAVWRKTHAHHHSTSGNLDQQGMGDVVTRTVEEYAALTRTQKILYRLYRSPFVLFGLAPAYFDHDADWNIQDAAFHGSSHYKLPPVLNWLTANIGIHHVHHLNCRIPFYRLPEVLNDHAALAHMQTITLAQSFKCARLHLWDENQRKLLSFADARALRASA